MAWLLLSSHKPARPPWFACGLPLSPPPSVTPIALTRMANDWPSDSAQSSGSKIHCFTQCYSNGVREGDKHNTSNGPGNNRTQDTEPRWVRWGRGHPSGRQGGNWVGGDGRVRFGCLDPEEPRIIPGGSTFCGCLVWVWRCFGCRMCRWFFRRVRMGARPCVW